MSSCNAWRDVRRHAGPLLLMKRPPPAAPTARAPERAPVIQSADAMGPECPWAPAWQTRPPYPIDPVRQNRGEDTSQRNRSVPMISSIRVDKILVAKRSQDLTIPLCVIWCRNRVAVNSGIDRLLE